MTVNREERAKQRLRSALDHVQRCIRTSGDETHPLIQLQVAESELQKMLTALEQGAMDQHRPSGLWRMITDGWPLRDALGEEIVAAELDFDHLMKLGR